MKSVWDNALALWLAGGRLLVNTLAFIIFLSLPTAWAAAWWRGTDMCPPTSTAHTQWNELSHYRDSLNNREPSPAKSLENSFWLEFSGLLPHVSLSVWLLFYIYVCHHLDLLCWVTTGPLEWKHTNGRKPKTDGELLDWQWNGYPPWVFWICCTNWI